MNIFLEVNNYCNQQCLFCVADNGFKYSPINIESSFVEKVLDHYQIGSGNAVFITGGEPLLHPHINELMRLIKRRKAYMSITTTGTVLSDERKAAEMVLSGMNSVAIPLYGASAAQHDYMTGAKGSFERTMKGIRNLIDIRDLSGSSMRIELRILMSKFTLQHNDSILELIFEHFPEVNHIGILGLQLSSRTNKYSEEVEISLREAADNIRGNIRRVLKHRKKLTLSGIPVCIVGEEFSKLIHSSSGDITKTKIDLFPHISVGPYMKELSQCIVRERTSKEKGGVCSSCKFYNQCEGINLRYKQRYGFQDLIPLMS